MISASLDHVILGCNDLARAIEWVEKRTGVRAALGGAHPGLGTRNALLSLGPQCYLELMAPDLSQNALAWFRSLTQLSEPRLIGWAAHSTDVAALTERLRKAGVACQAPREGSRRRPDGSTLHWKTVMLADDRQGLLPFFIEWSAESAHPAEGTASGCRLERFEIITPDPEQLKRTFQLFGIDVQIAYGPMPRLRARIACSAGSTELLS